MSIRSEVFDHVPYPLLFTAFYSWISVSRIPRMERARKELGLRALDELKLEERRTSDALFVMGSGSSINRIGSRRWGAIEKCDTWGFNFWLVHEHTPDLYFFEAIDPENKSPEVADVRVKMRLAMERATERYQHVPVVLTDFEMERLEFLRSLPKRWQQDIYAGSTIPAVARSEKELRRCLRNLDEAGLFDKGTPAHPFKYQATLSMLVSLGVQAGYKRIVLCGVDLNTPGYFYQDHSKYPQFAKTRSSPPGKVHATIVKRRFMRPIDEVLYALRDQVLQPRGVELYVEHERSELASGLPVPETDVIEGWARG